MTGANGDPFAVHDRANVVRVTPSITNERMLALCGAVPMMRTPSILSIVRVAYSSRSRSWRPMSKPIDEM